MAIQVGGVTVIDDSRNLVSVGLTGTITQAASCNVRSYKNIVTLTGTTTKTATIDCSSGNYFSIDGTVTQLPITLAFTNNPANGYLYTCLINMKPGVFDQLVYPSNVYWGNSTKPTMEYSTYNLLFLTTDDGGSKWRAALLNNYYS